MVENLIIDFGFTDQQAAKAAVVSIDFVIKVRAELEAKKQVYKYLKHIQRKGSRNHY